jgi:hypothetical protein
MIKKLTKNDKGERNGNLEFPSISLNKSNRNEIKDLQIDCKLWTRKKY